MKRIKPSEGNKTFCMAPWTHTYLSPQMERRCVVHPEESTELQTVHRHSGMKPKSTNHFHSKNIGIQIT